MPATIQHVSETEVVLEVRVPLGRSMLDNERAIQQALNAAGNLARLISRIGGSRRASVRLCGPFSFLVGGRSH